MISLVKLKSDFVSGFIVFLIALPLCIGISIASGTPPTAGIVAAVVGGLVGAFIGGSPLAISGPAAGLIVIVFAAVEELGRGDAMVGFRAMLACTIFAGIFQILLGLLKAGRIGLSFPGSVVHGMLSAIGLIIIGKQFHTLLGVTASGLSPLASLAAIPHSFTHMNLAIGLIGLMSLALMILITRRKTGVLKRTPAPLVAALAAVGAGLFMGLENDHTVHTLFGDALVGPAFLLAVPSRIADALIFPNFAQIGSFVFWKHTLLITFVASIESILSVCAVDRLDPEKRKSNLDRELVGKGLCNMLSGGIGGLPLIAEIVRSSANISNGAKSHWSNFFHAAFLLIFLALVPGYLHLVPTASLAAILVFVGYQLAKPSHFFHAFQKGHDSGFVFVTTVVAILATDLLLGVVIGGAAELAIVLWRGRSMSVFRVASTQKNHENYEEIRVTGPLAFSNYLPLKTMIERNRLQPRLTLDLRRTRMIDHTVMEHLSRHRDDFADRGQELDLRFSDHHVGLSAHPHATRVRRPRVARMRANAKAATIGS